MSWETWAAGTSRCPHCEGLDDGDFEAICDCSRWSVEQGRGQPGIEVIGRPETRTPIGPTPAPGEVEKFQT